MAYGPVRSRTIGPHVLQSQAMRAGVALVLTMLWLSAFGGFCGASSNTSSSSSSSTKTSPIVGYWTFKGGVVHIEASGSGYKGVMTQRPTDGACAEPVGYVLLKLT